MNSGFRNINLAASRLDKYLATILTSISKNNRPFAASHSRRTKRPYWRAKEALGQDKQRKLLFKIMYAFCLSCLSAFFALQHGGFVPRERLAAKGLLLNVTKSLWTS